MLELVSYVRRLDARLTNRLDHVSRLIGRALELTGMNDFVVKPVTREQLSAALRRKIGASGAGEERLIA